MGHYLELATWKRREHFALFKRAVQPFFSLTVELDVTGIRGRCDQPNGPPFFLAALYACVRAANDTDAFRLRIRKGQVWQHDEVGITSTILRDDDTFGFGRFELTDTLEEFVRAGREELQRVGRVASLVIPEPADDALIFHSTIPWLRFTAFTNAIGRADDSVPRVVFGRCTREGGRATMPVSVEVHHAVVDGLDVARFVQRLQEELRLATSD